MTWMVVFAACSIVLAWCYMKRLMLRQRDAALSYHFEFTSDEVFEGEYLYLIQEITNDHDEPVAFLKTETLLPQGLKIVLANDGMLYSGKDEICQSVVSTLTLEPHSTVRRRWRVLADKRGVYTAEMVELHAIFNDPLGVYAQSRRLQPEDAGHGRVIVLPRVKEWMRNMALSPGYGGERVLPTGLVQDPMTFQGVRDYEARDPLNTVDWKQSAKLGHLVVRKSEFQYNDSYNIVLNMQSALIEPKPPEISTPAYIEDCIGICAALLDSAVRRDIPVALIANAPVVEEYGQALCQEDEIGRAMFCSEEYRRQAQVIVAYRMLASLPTQMTVPIEKVLDDMLARPQYYARGGNIVLVSAYVNQRMLDFYFAMKERGVQVIFYCATAYQNAIFIPPEVPIYFRVSSWVGGVGYAV